MFANSSVASVGLRAICHEQVARGYYSVNLFNLIKLWTCNVEVCWLETRTRYKKMLDTD